MPTSRTQHISYIAQKVYEIQPKSILDIGVGFGKFGMIFREFTDIWNERYKREDWQTKIDGVEAFEGYITPLQKEIYTNIFIGDVLKMELPKYELVFLGDVLEHFTKEEGIKLLNSLKANHIIISTPVIVSNQGEAFGNIYETHKSQWTPADFQGWEVNTFGPTMIAEYHKQVYYCEGMKFFGERTGLQRYQGGDNPLLFIGMYFQQDYDTYKAHNGLKEVLWCGSDVQKLLDNKDWQEIVKSKECEHFANSQQLSDELKIIGIDAPVRITFFGDVNKYPVSYKQSDNPQVYMTCNDGREAEYGVDKVLEVAPLYPEITFHIYGINGISGLNVVFHGWTDEKEMDEQTKDMQGCIRLNNHDGVSQTLMKCCLRGQYPITELSQLKKLKDKKEPNYTDREKYLKIIENGLV